MQPRRREVALGAVMAVATLVASSPRLPFVLQLPAGAVVFVLPGYAWCRALLPPDTRGTAEELLGTLSLAFANIIAVSLLLYLTPWSLDARSWSIASALSTLVALIVCTIRNPAPSEPLPWGNWPVPQRRDVVFIALAVAVLAVTALIAFRPLKPPSGVTGYSELALVPVGEQLRITVGCFELQTTHYHVDLVSDGAVVQSWDDIVLAPSRAWTQDVAPAGSLIEVRLYRSGVDDPSTPYRRVHLQLRPATTPPP